MSYMHINNLYKEQEILLFKECYALEKIHGTSAHISWNEGKVGFFAGGCKHEDFVALFDPEALAQEFVRHIGGTKAIVYGEAYGGKMQGMRKTYGDSLRFVAFEAKIDGCWLDVPSAEDVATKLGLQFVHYMKIPANISFIDAERDADSIQAIRNGMGEGKMREGIVLRPPIEVTKNNGERVIAKHKRDEFKEMTSRRKVVPLDQLEVLKDAEKVAFEWVTTERLKHILDKLPQGIGIEGTSDVARAMVEDVNREGRGEFIESKDVRKAISKRAVKLFHQMLKERIHDET